MNAFAQKRRHKRIGLEHMDVAAKTVFSSECKILDIGLNGVCIATTQWMTTDHDYSIKFHLDGKLVSNSGTVRWVKLVGTRQGGNGDAVPIYMAGIEFKSVFTGTGRDIIHLLNTYAENKENRLSGKRFKLKTPAKAFFHILKDCRIKQISSGGMLIETDLDFLVNNKYSWAFHFPGDDRIIRCKGRIASRIGSSGSSRLHRMGVAFVDMQKDDRINLTHFVMKAMFTGLKTSLLH